MWNCSNPESSREKRSYGSVFYYNNSGPGGAIIIKTIAIILSFLLCIHALPGAHAQDKQDGRPLIAVFPHKFPPIYTVSQNGLPTGFGIELMEEVAREAGLQIEYRSTPTWFDAMKALAEGRADLIPDMGITPDRMKEFDFSRPTHSIPISLFVRSDNKDIHSLDDLRGRVTGVVRTNIGIAILSMHPDVIEKEYLSLNDLYVALLMGEVEAAIYPEPNFIMLMVDLGTQGRIKTVGKPITVVHRGIAVRKGNTALLEKINPAITVVLQSPPYQQMLQRWFPGPPSFWNSKRVALLLALMLLLMAVAWQMNRVRILRHMNKSLAEANTFSNAILDAASEGIISVDAQGNVVSVNDACENMFGMAEQELVGRSLHWLISGPDAKSLADSIRFYRDASPAERIWDNQRIWECAARRSDGDLFPVRLGVAPMEIDGKLNFVCTLIDETRARRAEIRAEQLLNHDPLTGLLNLHGIREALDKIIFNRTSPRLACLCVGMRRLTYINGVYGRRVGDQLLIQAASIIQETAVRSEEHIELIGRTGGERFFVVISYNTPDSVVQLAENIARQFNEFHVSYGDRGETIQADAHIGIAYYPEHGNSTEELIYHTEVAFHYAREMKLETIHVFNQKEKIEQSDAEHALQRILSALKDNRVVLHFQPIKHIASGAINHYEALVRLREPDGTLVMPADIIPPAERFGLITRLDYRVMELIMSSLPPLQEQHPDLSIAANLSASHLGNSNLFAWLKELFKNQPVAATSMIFEITESAALQNIVNIKKFMHELKELGCKFSLDDFGVGFTSFAQLRDLPVDIVKIDGTFVRDLCHNEEDKTLVKALTEVAHSLGKQVVAEFVEDEATLDLLRTYGVDYAQGYFIGKPSREIRGVIAVDHIQYTA